jgi:polar amino acid transport system substrate-binding protein
MFEHEFYGIACRKGTTTAKEIDTILAQLFADGTVADIADKYQVAPIANFTAGDQTNATDSSDIAEIKQKGKLVIGITEYKPMNYKDSNGKWVGFDTELAEAVCAKLGVTAEFVEITWDNKLIDLEAGTIDCIWNGMTITQAIKNAAEVTGAYMENGQVIVIKEGAFATPTDLAGKRIAVEGGSAGETQAKANFANSEIKTVEAQTDALLEVKSGASDACIIDLIMAKALLNSEK